MTTHHAPTIWTLTIAGRPVLACIARPFDAPPHVGHAFLLLALADADEPDSVPVGTRVLNGAETPGELLRFTSDPKSGIDSLLAEAALSVEPSAPRGDA